MPSIETCETSDDSITQIAKMVDKDDIVSKTKQEENVKSDESFDSDMILKSKMGSEVNSVLEGSETNVNGLCSDFESLKLKNEIDSESKGQRVLEDGVNLKDRDWVESEDRTRKGIRLEDLPEKLVGGLTKSEVDDLVKSSEDVSSEGGGGLGQHDPNVVGNGQEPRRKIPEENEEPEGDETSDEASEEGDAELAVEHLGSELGKLYIRVGDEQKSSDGFPIAQIGKHPSPSFDVPVMKARNENLENPIRADGTDKRMVSKAPIGGVCTVGETDRDTRRRGRNASMTGGGIISQNENVSLNGSRFEENEVIKAQRIGNAGDFCHPDDALTTRTSSRSRMTGGTVKTAGSNFGSLPQLNDTMAMPLPRQNQFLNFGTNPSYYQTSQNAGYDFANQQPGMYNISDHSDFNFGPNQSPSMPLHPQLPQTGFTAQQGLTRNMPSQIDRLQQSDQIVPDGADLSSELQNPISLIEEFLHNSEKKLTTDGYSDPDTLVPSPQSLSSGFGSPQYSIASPADSTSCDSEKLRKSESEDEGIGRLTPRKTCLDPDAELSLIEEFINEQGKKDCPPVEIGNQEKVENKGSLLNTLLCRPPMPLQPKPNQSLNDATSNMLNATVVPSTLGNFKQGPVSQSAAGVLGTTAGIAIPNTSGVAMPSVANAGIAVTNTASGIPASKMTSAANVASVAGTAMSNRTTVAPQGNYGMVPNGSATPGNTAIVQPISTTVTTVGNTSQVTSAAPVTILVVMPEQKPKLQRKILPKTDSVSSSSTTSPISSKPKPKKPGRKKGSKNSSNNSQSPQFSASPQGPDSVFTFSPESNVTSPLASDLSNGVPSPYGSQGQPSPGGSSGVPSPRGPDSKHPDIPEWARNFQCPPQPFQPAGQTKDASFLGQSAGLGQSGAVNTQRASTTAANGSSTQTSSVSAAAAAASTRSKDFTLVNSTPDDKLREVNDDGDSWLHIYVLYGMVHRVDAILSLAKRKGFLEEIIDAQNDEGQTPLLMATLLNNPEIVKILLEWGADAKIEDRKYHSPLHYAIKSCQFGIGMLRLLLEVPRRKLDLNVTDTDGLSPLHVAIQAHGRPLSDSNDTGNSLETVRLLFRHGASANLKSSKDGFNPLHLAIKAKSLEMVKEVLSQPKGQDLVFESSGNGNTPLHCAAELPIQSRADHKALCQLLISKGANLDSQNNELKKPKDLVYDAGNRPEVVELLKIPRVRRVSNHNSCSNGSSTNVEPPSRPQQNLAFSQIDEEFRQIQEHYKLANQRKQMQPSEFDFLNHGQQDFSGLVVSSASNVTDGYQIGVDNVNLNSANKMYSVSSANQTTLPGVNNGVNMYQQGQFTGVNHPGMQSGVTQTGMHGVSQSGVHGVTQTGMHDASQNGAHGVSQTGMHFVNQTGMQSVNNTGMPNLNNTGMPNLNNTGMPSLNNTGMPNLNNTGMQSVNNTGMHHVNPTGMHGVNTTNSGYTQQMPGSGMAYDGSWNPSQVPSQPANVLYSRQQEGQNIFEGAGQADFDWSDQF